MTVGEELPKQISTTNKRLSVLKKTSPYNSCMQYFEVQRTVEELLLTYRLYSKTTRTVPNGYANDDCLYSSQRNCVKEDEETRMRIVNAAYRILCYHQFRKSLNCGFAFVNISSNRRRRSVCFNDSVKEVIIPSLESVSLTEDPEYDEEEIGLIDNLGSVCCNILLTLSSFLAPYSTKKLKSWLS